ncbi:hypothetical protein TSAR_008277 [Trichomalopsis sarcophagae]|uniref:Uncharacterized protein n=1 Tax=Trichomalopsis sarcophagae TaxID=543379 RepID=A0A232ELX9_9HYME|nr:hypothetical protein TSAR_008277 [Trichomalopsis sarcophagae]
MVLATGNQDMLRIARILADKGEFKYALDVLKNVHLDQPGEIMKARIYFAAAIKLTRSVEFLYRPTDEMKEKQQYYLNAAFNHLRNAELMKEDTTG